MTSKTQNVVEGSKQCRSFRMCLNLNDYHLKTSSSNYGSKDMNLVATTNQKHTIHIQKNRKKGTQSYY